MRANKNKRLNLGLLVDKPFPHPTQKDSKGIINLCFELSDSVYDMYCHLLTGKESRLGERALITSNRIGKRLTHAFATENKAEYLENMELAMDAVVETRFWLKEIQMKFDYSDFYDEAVERANELIAVLSYISEGVTKENKVHFITLN
jgi:hypothetical protein